MIDDLLHVVVGTGMMEGRGRGPFFAGNVFGASGFRAVFRDNFNQLQHAAAGLIIGYKYGKPGEWFARYREREPQDDLLYEVICPIGRWLYFNPERFREFAGRVAVALSDGTCYAPFAR